MFGNWSEEKNVSQQQHLEMAERGYDIGGQHTGGLSKRRGKSRCPCIARRSTTSSVSTS